MCEHGDTVTLFVNIPAHLSSTGRTYWGYKAVDRCLADLVWALNRAGILTASCCCGHGRGDGSILLQDGRELVIRRASEDAPERGAGGVGVMLSAEYINAIRSMYKLTLTEFWLYYQLMHNVDWNQWPNDLQRIVSDWGRQHGTQSYDIRADLIAQWVRDLRDQGA